MDIAVSVIVPVFNGEATIERCIKSISEQSLRNIEIIVVDDGSADSTNSIIRSIGDERIHIITQGNMGQGFARNAGIEAASGEYIAFVDADDTIEKDMLLVMSERAKETGADIVQCNICDIFPDGRKVIQLEAVDGTVEITDTGRYTDKYFACCRHSYEVCNKLIKREVLESSGICFCDTRKYFSEDLLFNMYLIENLKKISFIGKAYYNYYQNDSSHFHSDYKMRLEGIYKLFYDYISNADKKTAKAVSYTASMVLLYNIGFCADSADEILCGQFFKKCVTNAVLRNIDIKHRIFLAAVRILPLSVKKLLAKAYSRRWN